MTKKLRKTKLPRSVEAVLRFHVPASLPPWFLNIFEAALVRARACPELAAKGLTAKAEEVIFREFKQQAEEYHKQMDKQRDWFREEKLVVLLKHYGIPEDAPGRWYSADAGWRLAWALAFDFVPGIAPTDTPIKPVGRQRKTADEKLVMQVETELAKRGGDYGEAFKAVARMREYKNRSPRKGGWGWVKPAYYKAKREMSRPSLAKLFQEGQ
jgi:hypothetical protein